MNCNQVSENIDKYLENRLDLGQMNDLQDHIDKCKKCRLEFEEMKQIFFILDDKTELEPPLDFTENIMKKVKLNNKTTSNKKRRIFGSSLIAAGLLIFMMNSFSINYNLNILSENLYLSTTSLNERIVKPLNNMSSFINISLEKFNKEVTK